MSALPSTAESKIARRISGRSWLEPLLLGLVLALWFGYELGDRALWAPDEGRYAEIPREMVETGDYLTPRLNGVKYFEKPPLVYWLQAGAIKTFGLGEWALRLWPAGFGLLGCLAVYFIGRRLYGRRTGLFAAVILAISPLYDFMGAILTLDMPLTALLTVALGAFLIGTRAPPGMARRGWFYLFYLTSALTVLTKGLVGIVIPGMVIGAWIAILGEWRLLRAMYLPTGLLLFLAVAGPWHYFVAQANPEFNQFYFVHEHLQRYLTKVHQRYEPMWFFIPVLFAGMYPWSAFLPHMLRDMSRGFWRERRQHREIWFLCLWALLPFLFFSLSSSKLIPYILPILPPLALLFGRWLARMLDQPKRFGHTEFVLLLLLGVFFTAAIVLAAIFLPNHPSVARATTQIGPGLFFMAISMLLAGLLPFCANLWHNRYTTILALFAGATLLIGTFDHYLSRVDAGRSVKDLAMDLRKVLAPGDEVMTYQAYYQDLPVYIRQRVTIVDWKGELEFGTTVEDTSAWMIDQEMLRRRWLEPRTIYLLTDTSNYNNLLLVLPGSACLLRSTERVVLINNRKCHS